MWVRVVSVNYEAPSQLCPSRGFQCLRSRGRGQGNVGVELQTELHETDPKLSGSIPRLWEFPPGKRHWVYMGEMLSSLQSVAS